MLTFLLPPVQAENWDDYTDLDKAWEGQKTVTNKEYDEVIDALKAQEKKREAKKKKKLFKRLLGGGDSLHEELSPDNEIKEIPDFKSNDKGLLLNVPVEITLDNNILDRGFYKVLGERNDDGKICIKFYQSQFFKGEVQAIETQDDYGEESIDFVRIVPYNDSFVKIIFGSIDFNAYALIPFQN